MEGRRGEGEAGELGWRASVLYEAENALEHVSRKICEHCCRVGEANPLAQLSGDNRTALTRSTVLDWPAKDADELRLSAPMTLRRYARLYGVLALLRILIAFTSTSAIHPDEHFQNPEIAASTVFEYSRLDGGLLRTWEWEGPNPCRSIVPVLGSTGWTFALSKLAMGDSQSIRWRTCAAAGTNVAICAEPTGYALFLAQRLAMLLFSFFIGDLGCSGLHQHG